MDPDDREFMRELLLRHERYTNAAVRAYERMETKLEAMTRKTEASTATLLSLREDSKAHTQSIFRLIDRIDHLGENWLRGG